MMLSMMNVVLGAACVGVGVAEAFDSLGNTRSYPAYIVGALYPKGDSQCQQLPLQVFTNPFFDESSVNDCGPKFQQSNETRFYLNFHQSDKSWDAAMPRLRPSTVYLFQLIYKRDDCTGDNIESFVGTELTADCLQTRDDTFEKVQCDANDICSMTFFSDSECLVDRPSPDLEYPLNKCEPIGFDGTQFNKYVNIATDRYGRLVQPLATFGTKERNRVHATSLFSTASCADAPYFIRTTYTKDPCQVSQVVYDQCTPKDAPIDPLTSQDPERGRVQTCEAREYESIQQLTSYFKPELPSAETYIRYTRYHGTGCDRSKVILSYSFLRSSLPLYETVGCFPEPGIKAAYHPDYGFKITGFFDDACSMTIYGYHYAFLPPNEFGACLEDLNGYSYIVETVADKAAVKEIILNLQTVKASA